MPIRNLCLPLLAMLAFATAPVGNTGLRDGGGGWGSGWGGAFDPAAGPLVRTKALQGLYSEDIATRDRSYHGVAEDRQLMIRELIKLASEQVQPTGRTVGPDAVPEYPFHHRKHLAMLLLGDLRAPEAVPVLLDNLHYWAPRTHFQGSAGGHTFRPAADSLARIGKPAIQPTIHKVATTEDQVERELCCWIIQQVEGKELAPIVLQLAIDKEQYSSRKKRLQAALEHLQKER